MEQEHARLFAVAYKVPAALDFFAANMELMMRVVAREADPENAMVYAEYLHVRWLMTERARPVVAVALPSPRRFLAKCTADQLTSASLLLELIHCLCHLMRARARNHGRATLVFVAAITWERHMGPCWRDARLYTRVLMDRIGWSHVLGRALFALLDWYDLVVGLTFGVDYDNIRDVMRHAEAFEAIAGEVKALLAEQPMARASLERLARLKA